MKILIGLVIVISAIVLLSGCVQKLPQEIQDQTTPTPTPTAPTTIQKSELSKEIDEINSMVEDFENLSNSVDELDENEDLLQVFKGD